MSWRHQVLVVANVTATSPELLRTLKGRSERGSTSFLLIVPATPFEGGRATATRRVGEAVHSLRELGLQVDGTIGDGDPVVAVVEAWDPTKYDEVIVSTLPVGWSRCLRAGLPRRIEKLTGALVTHVVAEPAKPEIRAPRARAAAGAR